MVEERERQSVRARLEPFEGEGVREREAFAPGRVDDSRREGYPDVVDHAKAKASRDSATPGTEAALDIGILAVEQDRHAADVIVGPEVRHGDGAGVRRVELERGRLAGPRRDPARPTRVRLSSRARLRHARVVEEEAPPSAAVGGERPDVGAT